MEHPAGSLGRLLVWPAALTTIALRVSLAFPAPATTATAVPRPSLDVCVSTQEDHRTCDGTPSAM